MAKHQLTPEERLAGNVNRRLRREKLEQEAVDTLAAKLGRAVEVFLDAMEAEDADAPDHATRIKGAREVVDRVLGRATQRTEISGSVDHHIEYRERLAARLADHVERAGTNGHS